MKKSRIRTLSGCATIVMAVAVAMGVILDLPVIATVAFVLFGCCLSVWVACAAVDGIGLGVEDE